MDNMDTVAVVVLDMVILQFRRYCNTAVLVVAATVEYYFGHWYCYCFCYYECSYYHCYPCIHGNLKEVEAASQ